jgi:L-ascorbate metabolism protein UlaG (beta-lactamase superfamily)
MDSPVPVRPAGNGPEGETGTTVRYQKTGGFLKPEGALIPPPKDAVQHRMGVEVHFDPFQISAEAHDADLICITHAHYDHFDPESILRAF